MSKQRPQMRSVFLVTALLCVSIIAPPAVTAETEACRNSLAAPVKGPRSPYANDVPDPLHLTELLKNLTAEQASPTLVGESIYDLICNSTFAEDLLLSVSPDAGGTCAVLNGEVLSEVFMWFERYIEKSNYNTSFACFVTGLLENTIIKQWGVSKCPGKDDQIEPPSVDVDGAMIPVSLPDMRPLPPSIGVADMSTVAKATIAWHYRVLRNLYTFADCGYLGTQFLVPTNWHLLAVANMSNSIPPQPLMTAMLSPDTTLLVVSIRGTQSAADWRLDFAYNQTTSPFFPGLIHAGFLSIHNSLWSTVKAVLDSSVLQRGSNVRTVAVAGHSLGAGVATLTAYAVQDYLRVRIAAMNADPSYNTTREVAKVDAFLIAQPSVGDANFAAAFNRLVNARRVVYATDLVPMVPCNSSAACTAPGVPVPTNNSNATPWSYADVGGTVQISAAMMPTSSYYQSMAWADLDKLPLCNADLYVTATHGCSYQCWSSAFVNVPGTSQCLIWPVEGTADEHLLATQSYCTDFPANPPFPPCLLC